MIKLLVSSLVILFCGLFLRVHQTKSPAKSVLASSPPFPPTAFIVHSYQGRRRCLDYTPEKTGSPVFINDCNLAHSIVVEELDYGSHRVILHAGNKVIGIPFTTVVAEVKAALAAGETPLVLLTVNPTQPIGDHIFVLDGDSIILASNRQLVAQVEQGRGAVGTPVVLGARQLADNEFWNFTATDGSTKVPSSGFESVLSGSDLQTDLQNATPNTAELRQLAPKCGKKIRRL